MVSEMSDSEQGQVRILIGPSTLILQQGGTFVETVKGNHLN